VNSLPAASQKPVFPQIPVKPVSPVRRAVFKILPLEPHYAFHAQIELIALNEYLRPPRGRLIANPAFHEEQE